MTLPLSERFLLRKALVVRRISDTRSLPMEQLLKHLEEDEALVREKAPDFYYQDAWTDLHNDIQDCADDGLIEWVPGQTLKRTRLGNQFMNTLEPRLKDALDKMPMSGDALLDFLASL